MKTITIVYIQERIPRTRHDVLGKPKVFDVDDVEGIKRYSEELDKTISKRMNEEDVVSITLKVEDFKNESL